MTAVITVNTVAAPLGFIAAGQILERWGVNPVFAGVAVGITVAGVAFAGVVLRFGGDEPVPLAAGAQV
jgi:hypothetical protein